MGSRGLLKISLRPNLKWMGNGGVFGSEVEKVDMSDGIWLKLDIYQLKNLTDFNINGVIYFVLQYLLPLFKGVIC